MYWDYFMKNIYVQGIFPSKKAKEKIHYANFYTKYHDSVLS